jgi:hypothetical protein
MPIARIREFAGLTRDDATLAERIALLEEHDRDVEERIATLAASAIRSAARSPTTARSRGRARPAGDPAGAGPCVVGTAPHGYAVICSLGNRGVV